MAKIDLGKVTGAQLRMRGAYSSTSTYLNDDNYIDCVTYQGSLFICVKTTTGVAPTLTMTTPWVLGARGNETLTTLAQVQANTTAGKVADALAVRELNSKCSSERIELISYNAGAIDGVRFIMTKTGDQYNIHGQFHVSTTLPKSINQFNVGIHPDGYVIIPIMCTSNTSVAYGKLLSTGYIQFDSDVPVGFYFFNFSFVVV